MSLAGLREVEDQGVTFRSHLDGAAVALSPERAIEIQDLLGADIAMQLDECVKLPATPSEMERAMHRSLAWAERSKRAFADARQGRALFGIVQGGDDVQLRSASATALIDIGFDGYAIGGLAAGESREVTLAQGLLMVLWKALPRTHSADVTKLAVYVGALVALGICAALGLLPRTRPILPGELIVAD